MNKAILLFIVFFVFKDGLKAQKFTLAIERPSQIAYIGLDNPLSCTVEKEPCDSVLLSTDNGRIKKIRCNTYLYVPVKLADSKIIVSVKKRKKIRVIGTIIIRVREIPDPQASVGGLNGGLIGKNNLLAQMGVASNLLPSIGIDIHYMATEFQVIILRKDSVLFSAKNLEAKFSEVVKDAFKLLNKNDRVVISSIFVKKPDGRIVLIKPIEFLIDE